MGYEPHLIAPFKSGLLNYWKPFLIGNDAFVELDNCYSQRGNIVKREGSSVLARITKWGASTGITNATPPVVTLAAHGLLTGDMVWLENVITTNGTITSISTGLTTTITTTGAHGMSSGQNQTIITTGTSNVARADGLPFDGAQYQIVSVTANTITINVSTTGTGVSAGTVLVGNLEKQAFQITKINANSFSLQNLTFPVTNVETPGVAASADIYLPIVGTRIFLLVSTGDEQLIVFIPKKAYLFNAATFTDISFDTTSTPITWAGTKDNFFYSSNFASVMWATNNVCNTVAQPVGIRFYNGSTANGWSDHQPLLSGTTYLNSALIILPYKGRLIVLNTTEGTNAGPPAQVNTVFRNRARWCQLGTPFVANAVSGFSNDATAWRSDIPGKGGFIDADTSEAIVSAQIIQDTLIVGFQFSTWRLRYTGNPILPFIWERISTTLGCEGTFSTVPFDEGMLEISRRGICNATFNDVSRIDLQVPDLVDSIECGSIAEGINRVHGIRDFNKRMVYWLYGDEADNAQTPNKLICYNYQDNTWSTFTQSFTTLANYKKTTDNTWATWTTPWDGDTSTWDTPLDQQGTDIIVAGAKDSNLWWIMNEDVSTDNGNNFNFTITTGLINPYLDTDLKCRLAYYDLYVEATSNGQVTVLNYTDDNPSDPWIERTVNVSDTVATSKYVRVFLGMVARNHQITITLSPSQLEDANIGGSDFKLQGIVFHTRGTGRIKR